MQIKATLGSGFNPQAWWTRVRPHAPYFAIGFAAAHLFLAQFFYVCGIALLSLLGIDISDALSEFDLSGLPELLVFVSPYPLAAGAICACISFWLARGRWVWLSCFSCLVGSVVASLGAGITLETDAFYGFETATWALLTGSALWSVLMCGTAIAKFEQVVRACSAAPMPL